MTVSIARASVENAAQIVVMAGELLHEIMNSIGVTVFILMKQKPEHS